jgi:class 3 adenylate cyclase
VLVGTATVLAVSTWLLGHGIYLPPAAIALTLVVAVGARTSYEASLQLRERRRLRRAFGAYVSPGIMRDILRSDPPPGLGGGRYGLCVLFADIRGFTERCERMPPEAAIGLLNRYFSEVTASIHGAGGTVDKFIGDGVMAFFGAPQRLDNPCAPAFRAARDMLERLSHLNDALAAQGEPPIAIGIGLHAGDAVVGNVGSDARHNYTAIGDTVNVASRLEGLTKEVDFPLVCSATVFAMLEDHAGFVKLGARAIKGHQPVEVYGWRPDDGRAAVPKVETP